MAHMCRPALVLLVTCFLAGFVPMVVTAQPSANLTRIASGFAWAENLWIVGDSDLFVSDIATGDISRVLKLDNGTWTKTTWVSGFHSCAGLTAPPFYQRFYVLALCELNDGTDTVIAFSTEQPQSFDTLLKSPTVKGNLSWNGLAVDPSTGWIYITDLSGFAPNAGNILAVDAHRQDSLTRTFAANLSSADGCFFDSHRHRLYVSEVFTAHVHVYDLNGGRPYVAREVGNYIAPGMKALDDMCIVQDGNSDDDYVIAADYAAGNVVMFKADGSGAGRVVASGLTHPTSVRRGVGATDSGFVYITEGAGNVYQLRMW